jgi:hypothetical protein
MLKIDFIYKNTTGYKLYVVLLKFGIHLHDNNYNLLKTDTDSNDWAKLCEPLPTKLDVSLHIFDNFMQICWLRQIQFSGKQIFQKLTEKGSNFLICKLPPDNMQIRSTFLIGDWRFTIMFIKIVQQVWIQETQAAYAWYVHEYDIQVSGHDMALCQT